MKLRIKVEGQSYDVEVEVLPETREEAAEGEPVLPPGVRRPPARSDIRPEDRVCRSPIAGVIVAVAVGLNSKVRQHDPVVVIEAMKMQTPIGAPVDGVVQQIHVTAGEQVKPGQILCTLV